LADWAGFLPQAIVLVLALTGIMGQATLSSAAKDLSSYIAQKGDPRGKIEEAAKLLATSMLAVTTFFSAVIAAALDTIASFLQAPSGWSVFVVSLSIYVLVILIYSFLALDRRIYELALLKPKPLTIAGKILYVPKRKISDWISRLTIVVLVGSLITAIAKTVYS
jgi:hypothetical protein